jgi:hypothetical protein
VCPPSSTLQILQPKTEATDIFKQYKTRKNAVHYYNRSRQRPLLSRHHRSRVLRHPWPTQRRVRHVLRDGGLRQRLPGRLVQANVRGNLHCRRRIVPRSADRGRRDQRYPMRRIHGQQLYKPPSSWGCVQLHFGRVVSSRSMSRKMCVIGMGRLTPISQCHPAFYSPEPEVQFRLLIKRRGVERISGYG